MNAAALELVLGAGFVLGAACGLAHGLFLLTSRPARSAARRGQ